MFGLVLVLCRLLGQRCVKESQRLRSFRAFFLQSARAVNAVPKPVEADRGELTTGSAASMSLLDAQFPESTDPGGEFDRTLPPRGDRISIITIYGHIFYFRYHNLTCHPEATGPS